MKQRSDSGGGRRPDLFSLVAMTVLGPAALNMFVPSMPGLRTAMNADYATAQLTVTFYLAALSIAQLLVGPLSDRFGRRPVAVAGLALFALASLGCAMASSIEQLIAGRVLQAAGGAAGLVVARAIVRDQFDRDQTASRLGYMTTLMVIGPMIAPAVGGFLDELGGWSAGFYVMALLGGLTCAVLYIRLPETRSARDGDPGVFRYFYNNTILLRDPLYLGYAFATSFGIAAFFTFLVGSPFIVTRILGATPSDFGIYFIAVSLGFMVGNFISGRYSGSLGTKSLLIAAAILSGIGLILTLLVAVADYRSLALFFIPIVVLTFSNGMLVPNGVASAISVRPEFAGVGSGLTGFLQFGTSALAAYALGLLHDGTRFPMVEVMVVCGALSTLFMVLAFRLQKRRPAH